MVSSLLLLSGFCSASAFCVTSKTTPNNRASKKTVSKVLVEPTYDLVNAFGSASVVATCAAALCQGLSRNVLAIGGVGCALLCNYVIEKTENVRFSFDESSFLIVKPDGSSIGEHPLFTGEYKWNLDEDVVNYGFLPSYEKALFLYLKETRTPESRRIDSPISIDRLPGQVHIFPMIGEKRQLRNGFVRGRCIEIPEHPHFEIETDPRAFVRGLALI